MRVFVVFPESLFRNTGKTSIARAMRYEQRLAAG